MTPPPVASPFASAGPRLWENGVSVIPIMATGQAPGRWSATMGWVHEHDWSRFCDRMPTAIEMEIWPGWAAANVGAALGASSGPGAWQLVAVDLDTDDPAIKTAVYGAIPQSPVKKRGRKGETGFYLASAAVVNRPYNDANKQRLLDLLCHGRQTVLPPSVHPKTGQPYVWITPDTLETFTLSDLPILPDDVGDLIGEALAPWGYDPAQHHQPGLGARGEADLDGDSIHRSLNDAALANLDAWVPALQLYKCRRTGEGKYKAVASWRPSSSGRPLSERATNLAISGIGIKDCGENRGYTPLDLVMAACDIDLDTAFKFLQEHVAPAKPITLSLTPPKEAQPPPPTDVQPEPDLTNVVGINGGDLSEVIKIPPSDNPQVIAPTTATLPEEFCTPAGLLGEIVEWITATAATPVPQLNLGAAIALMGTLCGRRWESPTRARTNFYVMGLAESGAGKDHPQDAVRHLAMACGLEKFMAAEETKSDSAIRKVLERYPVTFMVMDELGGWMRKILDRRAAAHDKRMRDLLLTFFSRANGDYMGAEGASERAVMIRNPHLCIFGCSTPTDMWKAFDSASGEDGLLARFLVFDVGDARPQWHNPEMDVSTPPGRLKQRILDLMNVRPEGNLNGVGPGAVKPIRAQWGDQADQWWFGYRQANVVMARRGGARATVYSRAAEHALKLALLLAVGCDPGRPVITVSALEWAKAVVESSMAALFAAMDDRIADSDHQAAYLWVKRFIQDAGQHGVPASVLRKAINGRFDKRRTDDILGQLTEAHEIVSWVGTGPNGGRPSMRYRVMRADEVAA